MPDEAIPPTRLLGPGGPEVPPFALGSWNTWDRMSPADAVALVERAVEAGVSFFDVAYYNMGPHAENSRTDILFGEAVRAAGLLRDEFQVCGKLWLWDYPSSGFDAQMAESLERARLDRFDTVVVGDYLDSPDIERVVSDASGLVAEGVFGSWGINNWRIGDTRVALDFAHREGLVPPSFAQLKYSLVRRSMAEGGHYGPLFDEGVLALQASDVFEGGILAGRLQPQRKIGADVGGIRQAIVEAYPEVQRIAAGLGTTPTRLGIAFCLANPATANVLFGVSRRAQLEENLGALDLLRTHGAEAIRAAAAGLQRDGAVDPDGSW